MKNWKSILITVFCFFAVGGMVLFNSCVKDPCSDLRCQNKGSCSDGFCQCPTGFEGSECEITAASRFVGTWVGNYRCSNGSSSFPLQPDTVKITLQEAPNTIQMKSGQGFTANKGFTGIAATPQTTFNDLKQNVEQENGSITYAYMYVDGGLIQVHIRTVPTKNGVEQNDQVQNCHFSGTRISTN